MIYLPSLDMVFNDFDALLQWFCSDFPAEDDMISSEAALFIKEHFPLINLDEFWVSYRSEQCYDAGFVYNTFCVDYNTAELRRCYPEYFL